MKPYGLLIFDWDGTVVDSAGQIVAAMRQAIADLGLPPRADEQMSRLIGLGLEDAFSRLYPELNSGDLLAIFAAYRRRFRGRPQNVHGLPFGGVEQALDALAEAGYELAVATGKSRRGLNESLASLGWAPRFVATRCADETASKPDPMMLGELLLERAIPPEQALMIGDTSYDIEMAVRGGIAAVGVSCGVHQADELLTSGAIAVLPDIASLPAWLQQRGASIP